MTNPTGKLKFAYDTIRNLEAEIAALKQALAQPYPEYDRGFSNGWDKCAERHATAQPEQEPVAWLTRDDGDGLWYSTNFKQSDDDRPLFTSPPPCPTCEALARTVMLDQTSHDTRREWVGLTDKDISVVVDAYTFDSAGYEIWTDGEALARDVQAKLKEKNT